MEELGGQDCSHGCGQRADEGRRLPGTERDRQLDAAGSVQGDADTPTFGGGGLGQGGGELVTVESERGSAQSEGAAGIKEGPPTLVKVRAACMACSNLVGGIRENLNKHPMNRETWACVSA